MLGRANLDCTVLASTEGAARRDQVYRVECVAAVVALVATGCCIATVWTGPLDITVGQEASIGRTVGREHGVFIDESFLVECEKEILRDTIVIFCPRFGIEIPCHAEPVPDLTNLPVIIGYKFARRNALAIGIDQYRCSMLVAARNHQ